MAAIDGMRRAKAGDKTRRRCNCSSSIPLCIEPSRASRGTLAVRAVGYGFHPRRDSPVLSRASGASMHRGLWIDALPSSSRFGLDGRHRSFGRARLSRTVRSEEHTSELQSHSDLVCRLLLEKKKYNHVRMYLWSA